MTDTPKGDGIYAPHKTRWVMRHSNGDEFQTSGYYTQDEVEQWEISRPVRAVPDQQVTA